VLRRALEALAVEGYRTGALTETQIKRLLGFESRLQVHSLLKEHVADAHEDLAAHRKLGILPER